MTEEILQLFAKLQARDSRTVSHLDQFVKLMDQFGLKLDLYAKEPDIETADSGQTSVRLKCSHGHPRPKVTGYYGFYASFEFNSDGSFREVGIWE